MFWPLSVLISTIIKDIIITRVTISISIRPSQKMRETRIQTLQSLPGLSIKPIDHMSMTVILMNQRIGMEITNASSRGNVKEPQYARLTSTAVAKSVGAEVLLLAHLLGHLIATKRIKAMSPEESN